MTMVGTGSDQMRFVSGANAFSLSLVLFLFRTFYENVFADPIATQITISTFPGQNVKNEFSNVDFAIFFLYGDEKTFLPTR